MLAGKRYLWGCLPPALWRLINDQAKGRMHAGTASGAALHAVRAPWQWLHPHPIPSQTSPQPKP